MTLTVALSPEYKEVLAYLNSCSSTNFSNNHRKATHKTTNAAACHPLVVQRWMLTTYILSTATASRKIRAREKGRKGKSTRGSGQGSEVSKKSEFSLIKNDFDESNSVSESTSAGGTESGGTEEDDVQKEELEKGSVVNFVSFLVEKIWSV
ncbi:Uncharacterized protein Adt_42791 [Abeliophyllum distichum]|uniref:Uncharacterized protein n=1 Tax=Abeliophyllum distichum TaxID=126358 RepID=A0ABD1PSN6_9LAMI